MSGVYNQTYFNNHPLEQEREGVLYGVILKVVDSKAMIYESRELITIPYITVGKKSKSCTKSSKTIVILHLRNLVDTQSVSKFLPLFYPTFQKIILDKWLLVCYNIFIFERNRH
jgi:hypothetical protein